jgi:hypothetical protein
MVVFLPRMQDAALKGLIEEELNKSVSLQR